MENYPQNLQFSDEALKELLTSRRKTVEGFLATCLSPLDIPKHLKDAMEYSLLAGGKRIRPVLCLTTASLAGAREEQVLPFAAAIELIHTYSLIHDDLPAMDNDDLRRGKPSNHKAFGEATALLAGDALLTLAFSLMTKAQVQAEQLLLAIAELAKAAGAEGMCAGQEIDMEVTGHKSLSLEELRHLHALKTGALLGAACTTGVRLSSQDPSLYAAIKTYGQELGVAFQIVDDILDEVSDSATLGKPAHSDIKNAKATYPLLCGLEQSRALAKEHSLKAIAALEGLAGQDQALLVYLARYVVERVN
ncbi:MAG: polyprenyl synthetase family protein [Desulfovibrionaceae bacterium]|nr:polyprenyl synthetase family protein [Desulfovibrionaceae bacterium]